MEGLDKWLAERLSSPLGQIAWLLGLVAARLLLHFSSRKRKKKRRTPPKSPGTA